jgi:hypothetical protein
MLSDNVREFKTEDTEGDASCYPICLQRACGYTLLEGTLNQEFTEIAGQFSHEENHAPLTLRKK